MTDTIETFSEREEIEMLLPWYRTGKLSRDDHERVARYLARHPEMARQVEIIDEELGATVAANEAVRPPRSLTAATALAAATGRTGEARPGLLASLVGGLKDLFVLPQSGAIRWAGVAAALLILAQAGVIGALMDRAGTGGYETASGQATTAGDGAFALVRFKDAAAQGEVSALLQRLGMSIADGPRAGGLYRVRIGAATLTSEARGERLAQLKAAADIVVLATPAP